MTLCGHACFYATCPLFSVFMAVLFAELVHSATVAAVLLLTPNKECARTKMLALACTDLHGACLPTSTVCVLGDRSCCQVSCSTFLYVASISPCARRVRERKKKNLYHGTVKTLGSRRGPWDERAQLFDSVVISHGYFICPLSVENCSLRASACARVKFLRGFWVRGRVCGDRSVFVTSHHPARSSRALCSAWFELCFSHLRYFPFAIFLFDGSACLLLFTLLFKVSLLGSYHVFFAFTSHSASSDLQGSEDSVHRHIGQC